MSIARGTACPRSAFACIRTPPAPIDLNARFAARAQQERMAFEETYTHTRDEYQRCFSAKTACAYFPVNEMVGLLDGRIAGLAARDTKPVLPEELQAMRKEAQVIKWVFAMNLDRKDFADKVLEMAYAYGHLRGRFVVQEYLARLATHKAISSPH